MAALKEWYDPDETRELVIPNSDSERDELSIDFESESCDDDSSNSRAIDGDDRAESAMKATPKCQLTKKICREREGIGELLCVSPK